MDPVHVKVSTRPSWQRRRRSRSLDACRQCSTHRILSRSRSVFVQVSRQHQGSHGTSEAVMLDRLLHLRSPNFDTYWSRILVERTWTYDDVTKRGLSFITAPRARSGRLRQYLPSDTGIDHVVQQCSRCIIFKSKRHEDSSNWWLHQIHRRFQISNLRMEFRVRNPHL